jgi:hypothetical protein
MLCFRFSIWSDEVTLYNAVAVHIRDNHLSTE